MPHSREPARLLLRATAMGHRPFGASLLLSALCLSTFLFTRRRGGPEVNLTAAARRRANASTVSADDDTNCISGTAGPAVSGYDVVAYWSLSSGSAAVRGHSNHSADYGNYTFHFSSEANRAAFRSNASGYAPQFGGFCSWGIAEESVWTADTLGPDVDPNVWEIRDGKLYLFMYDLPRDKWLGEVTDDDLDASGDTSMYVADAEARWSAWFGAQVVFNTACYWRNATSGGNVNDDPG